MACAGTESVVVVEPLTAHPLDNETYGFDFTDRLPSAVTVGSVVVTQQVKDGYDDWAATTVGNQLTLGTPEANSATFDYEDEGGATVTVAIGKGVLLTITGGTAGLDYLLTVVVTGSDSSDYAKAFILQVRDGTE